MLPLRGTLLLLAIILAIVLTIRIHKPMPTFFKGLLGLLSLALLVECIGLITSYLGIANVVLYNAYASIEFIALLRLVLVLHPSWRSAVFIVATLGSGAMLLSVMTRGPHSYLAIEGLLVVGVINAVLSLLVLFDLTRNSHKALHLVPYFWFYSGLLIYFGGTLPILGCWMFLGQLDAELSQILYWIVVILAIVRYLCAASSGYLASQERSTA